MSAAGNHEFDQGWADLATGPCARTSRDWEYIAANVYDKATGEPALAEYWVKEFDGVTVGFIGAVTEELPVAGQPGGHRDIDVRHIVDSVNGVADQLTDGVRRRTAKPTCSSCSSTRARDTTHERDDRLARRSARS